jgi:hypothetical protein
MSPFGNVLPLHQDELPLPSAIKRRIDAQRVLTEENDEVEIWQCDFCCRPLLPLLRPAPAPPMHRRWCVRSRTPHHGLRSTGVDGVPRQHRHQPNVIRSRIRLEALAWVLRLPRHRDGRRAAERGRSRSMELASPRCPTDHRRRLPPVKGQDDVLDLL